MPTIVYRVSAFASKPFSGNPAVVCLLGAPATEQWMQQFAREMNVSESAFVYPQADGYHLRWFTPSIEVKLCGHATLATTHMLHELGRLADGEVARYHTLSGVLTGASRAGLIWLDFPARSTWETPAPEGLQSVLGARPVFVGKSKEDLLVELEDEEVVRGLEPNLEKLSSLDVRGVTVTAKATAPGVDFISRFFAPAVGIAEDPVTGSSHCALGPYWAPRLGKSSMVGYQASTRGGEVHVKLRGDRVLLGGKAITVFRGELP